MSDRMYQYDQAQKPMSEEQQAAMNNYFISWIIDSLSEKDFREALASATLYGTGWRHNLTKEGKRR